MKFKSKETLDFTYKIASDRGLPIPDILALYAELVAIQTEASTASGDFIINLDDGEGEGDEYA